MNSHAPRLPIIHATGGTRSRLIRRAKTLSLLSMGWMTVEAGVAILAALLAGSVALLGLVYDGHAYVPGSFSPSRFPVVSRRFAGVGFCRSG